MNINSVKILPGCFPSFTSCHFKARHINFDKMRTKNKNINYGTESITFYRNIGANTSIQFYSKC